MREQAAITDHSLADRCAARRAQIAARKQDIPLEVLQRRIAAQSKPRGFIKALKKKSAAPLLIADIRPPLTALNPAQENYDAALLAKTYAAAGATCLTVMTDPGHPGAKDIDLSAAKSAAALPVLRRDLMLEPYQIYESRALGADGVALLIAALSDAEAQELYDLTRALGMDAMVVVHDRYELKRAHKLTPAMISINNQNIKNHRIDIGTALTLASEIPELCLKATEAGIHDSHNLKLLKAEGYQAFSPGGADTAPPEIEALLRKLSARELTQTVN